MGIGFDFLVYVIVMGFLLIPVLVILVSAGYFLSRKKSQLVRRSILRWCIALPFLGVIYAILCIILFATFSVFTGRDPGFGDSYLISLPNNYVFTAIDNLDECRIGPQGYQDYNWERDDPIAFDRVYSLQVSGDWLAGTYGGGKSFIFNTKTHERFTFFMNNKLLREAANKHGFDLNLESCDVFYLYHRYTFIDLCLIGVILIPPVMFANFLFRRLFRLWKSDSASLDGSIRDR
jgi:amino acid transporter